MGSHNMTPCSDAILLVFVQLHREATRRVAWCKAKSKREKENVGKRQNGSHIGWPLPIIPETLVLVLLVSNIAHGEYEYNKKQSQY